MTETTKVHLRLRRVLAMSLAVLVLIGLMLEATQPALVASRPGGVTTTTSIGVAIVGSTAHFTPISRTCHLSTSSDRSLEALGRCRILEIGDSLGIDLAEGLRATLGRRSGVNLATEGHVATGITNRYYYNWSGRLRQLLREFHPNLVVVFLGANDQHAIAVKGVSEPVGSPSWRLAYQGRVAQLARVATRSGVYVMWVGLPVMEDPRYDRGAQLLNSLVRREAQVTPGMTYLSTRTLLATSTGRFLTWARVNGVVARLRAPDGIHLLGPGARVLGTFVATQIVTRYRVTFRVSYPMVISGR